MGKSGLRCATEGNNAAAGAGAVRAVEPGKLRCDACRRVLRSADVLSAPNPFAPDEDVYGCPHCRAVTRFEVLCDEPGCEAAATCGFPLPGGYRLTCGVHYPRSS